MHVDLKVDEDDNKHAYFTVEGASKQEVLVMIDIIIRFVDGIRDLIVEDHDDDPPLVRDGVYRGTVKVFLLLESDALSRLKDLLGQS